MSDMLRLFARRTRELFSAYRETHREDYPLGTIMETSFDDTRLTVGVTAKFLQDPEVVRALSVNRAW